MNVDYDTYHNDPGAADEVAAFAEWQELFAAWPDSGPVIVAGSGPAGRAVKLSADQSTDPQVWLEQPIDPLDPDSWAPQPLSTVEGMDPIAAELADTYPSLAAWYAATVDSTWSA